MPAPTVSTEWASDASALKTDPNAAKRDFGWSTTTNTIEGDPLIPDLQTQNGWQNAVHQWILYLNDNIGGGGGGTGKNYIINPDAAVDATTGVDLSNTSGTFTNVRTTDPAKISELSKGTAHLASGDGSVAADDYIEYQIQNNIIDIVDVGKYGVGEVQIRDVGNIIAGSWKCGFYDKTLSEYVSEIIDLDETASIQTDVAFKGENDIVFHLIAKQALPNPIGLSGILIGPQTLNTVPIMEGFTKRTPLISDWRNSDGVSIAATSNFYYRAEQTGLRIIAAYRFSGDGTNGNPFAWEIGNIVTEITGGNVDTDLMQNNTYMPPWSGWWANISQDNFAPYYTIDRVDLYRYNNTTSVRGTNVGSVNPSHLQYVAFDILIPIAEWRQPTMPTIGEQQYANARLHSFGLTSAQSIPNVTATEVTVWNNISLEGGGTYSAGRYTVPDDGWYYISAQLRFSEPAMNGQIYVYIYINGAQLYVTMTDVDAAPNPTASATPPIKPLNAGDEVSIWVYQNDGGSRPLNTSDSYNHFTVAKWANFAAKKAGLPFATVDDPGLKKKKVTLQYRMNGNQAVVLGSNKVELDEVMYDNTNGDNFDTGTFLFTAPRAGAYLVNAQIVVGWTTSPSNQGTQTTVRKNEVDDLEALTWYTQDIIGSAGTDYHSMVCSGIVVLDAGDTLSLWYEGIAGTVYRSISTNTSTWMTVIEQD